MANIFEDAFKKAKPLQSSMLDDIPSMSVLSEGIPEDGETPLQLGFGDETPISEVAPAENSAQRWKRQADSFDGMMKNYLSPSTERKSGFLHLYDSIFNTGSLSRQQTGDILGIHGNAYKKAFGRIDARPTQSWDKTGGLVTGGLQTGGLGYRGGGSGVKAGASTFQNTNQSSNAFSNEWAQRQANYAI